MFQHIQNYGFVVVALLIVSGLSAAEDNAAFEQSNLYPVEYDANITISEFVELACNTLDDIFYHDLCQLTLDESEQLKDYSEIYRKASHDVRFMLTKQVLPNLDPNVIADFEYLINNCYILDEIRAFNKLLANSNVSPDTKTEAKKQIEKTVKDLLKWLIDQVPDFWGFGTAFRDLLNELLKIINEVLAVIRGGKSAKITTATSGAGLSEAGLTIMTVPLLMAGAILIVRRRRRKAA